MATTSSQTGNAVVAEATGPARPRRRRPLGQRRLWLFLVPAGAAYALIVLLPTLQSVFYSFTDWNGLTKSWHFIGIQNYDQILHNSIAIRAIINTALYAVITMVLLNLFGLLLALGLSSKIKSRNVLRVVFFLPVVLLSVVVGYLWEYLFSAGGVATDALHAIGFKDANPAWLGNPDFVVFSICIIVIWQFSGYTMVIYLAGLAGVPPDQIEA
ncbi:MAG: carbohydrate ABC transporter permease, partial [Acidimicrobiales bacterium]